MDYKLVAIDVDGTLLDDDKNISTENKKVIEKLADQGVSFILASGRPYQSLTPYTKKLEVYLPLISANGSVVKCSLTEKTYHKCNLPLDLAQEIINYGVENDYGVSVYYDGKIITTSQEMAEGHWELEKIRPEVVADLKLEKEPIKVIFYGTEEKIDQAYPFLRAEYQKKLYVTRSADEYLEVMNFEVSKGKALQYMIDKMNIKAEQVVVIGNNFNDVAMFEVAGVAVAMGNSPQEVKEEADFVTKSNQESGVADALKKIFLRKETDILS
ncbi:MAG: Cof-type HAD-IIB family hydrolase [Bacillota bacterium]